MLDFMCYECALAVELHCQYVYICCVTSGQYLIYPVVQLLATACDCLMKGKVLVELCLHVQARETGTWNYVPLESTDLLLAQVGLAMAVLAPDKGTTVRYPDETLAIQLGEEICDFPLPSVALGFSLAWQLLCCHGILGFSDLLAALCS